MHLGQGILVRLIVLVAAVLAATPLAAAGQDSAADAPAEITFPRDDAPHDGPLEWWYYTGHLRADNGDRFGFQQVVFKGTRGALTGYVGHVAVVDLSRETFSYDQRIVGDEGVAGPGPGFDFTIGDWRMAGSNGYDRLRAGVAGYSFDLKLAPGKPPVLHDGDGYIDYGNGTGSFYYSRTRMPATGTMIVDGQSLAVSGEAWMDHQWGTFDTFSEGGWDWLALQLDDGTDLMLYVVKNAAREPVIVDGSLVAPDGALTVLEPADFTLETTAEWTSERTGGTYPAAWTIGLPVAKLRLEVVPAVADQELDTRQTTGVVYWEGAVTVDGERDGEPIAGVGYVELTGYVPVESSPLQ